MKLKSEQQNYIMVSACLLGVNCRYDGKNAYNRSIASEISNHYIIFACPEQLGGLTTPRPKNRLVGDRVINENGVDVTDNFYRGAKEFLGIARRFGVKKMILKSRSPACGKQGILTRILPVNIEIEYRK